MDKIRVLQDRFIGNMEGCLELSRLLDERKTFFEERIIEINQQKDEQQSTN